MNTFNTQVSMHTRNIGFSIYTGLTKGAPYQTYLDGPGGEDPGFTNLANMGVNPNTTGITTNAAGAITFTPILSLSSIFMVRWICYFIPDITGYWYFSGSGVKSTLALFIMPRSYGTFGSLEGTYSYILALNNATAGYANSGSNTILLTANTKYYFYLTYSNISGSGAAFNFYVGRPQTVGGTGSAANQTRDFSNYLYY